MSYSIAIVLFVLWMAGLVAGFMIYGLIHAFLLLAIILAMISLMSEIKPSV